MSGMRWLLNGSIGVTALGAIACLTPAAGQTRLTAAPNQSCSVEALQAAAPPDVLVFSADHLMKPVAHCRVEGFVTTTNPGPNRNYFRLQLPDKSLWKGRYYFVGLGGSAGYVPTDSQIPGGNPMNAGFAVAGTDTGHRAPGLDWGFLSDPAKAVDHIHRGAHVVAVATQQMTKAYYGVEKIWRYHSGCSGGGRMGQEIIDKHPEDFDGVLLGWPGGRREAGHPAPPSNGAAFDIQVAEMTREPGAWLSPAKLKFAEEKVTEACDLTDGAKDGVVWDHRLCKFDFKKLQCQAGDAPNCLTRPEITSIENLLNKTSMPITNMSQWRFLGSVPPPWDPSPAPENASKTAAALVIETTWARAYLGQPDRDIVKTRLTKADLEAMNAAERRIGFNQYNDPDLRPFEKAGHKAIYWAGVSDPCCSNVAVENYIKDQGKKLGSPERLAKFVAFYNIPGAGHCGGGTGPNDHADQLLQTLIDWVELGRTPGGVIAHRGADRERFLFRTAANESGVLIPPSEGVARDFLLCPFPLVSVFDKSKAKTPGAVYVAANWSCKTSRS